MGLNNHVASAGGPSTDRRRVAVIELDGGGHRLVWVNLLLDELLANGIRPLLVLGNGVKNRPEFITHLGGYRDEIDIRWTALSWKSIGFSLVDRLEVEKVLIPDGDQAAALWGLAPMLAPRRVKTRLIVTRDPNWHVNDVGRIPAKQQVRRLAIASTIVIHQNVSVLNLCAPNAKGGSRRLVEDPVILTPEDYLGPDARESARRERRMSPDVKWIGIVGAIDERKNPALALRAIEAASESSPSALGLAIFGPVSESIRDDLDVAVKNLRSLGIPCIIDDTLRTNERLNWDIVALDILLMAYSSHSPNSTMAKAAALGTRVVAAGPPSLRRFVRDVTGRDGVQLNATSIAAELRFAISQPRPIRRSFRDWREFAKDVIGDLR